MSLVNLSSYLVTKVKGFTGVDAGHVFPYDNPQWGAFPAIAIVLKEFDGKFLTNQSNELIATYTIRIYQEVTKTNTGPATAEANLLALADAIITGFYNDNKLGNNDVYTLPIKGKAGWTGDSVRVYEIDVECHDVLTATG